MATHATDTWGTKRWDDDDDLTQETAQNVANALRERVNGYESVLSGESPVRAAALRHRHAPMYYDLHRAEELAQNFDRAKPQHMLTRALAANIARNAYPTLTDALDHLATLAPKDDIAREYMLWRHSLRFSPTESWGDQSVHEHASEHGLERKPLGVGEAVDLDDSLGRTFGNLTRSPQVGRLDAFQDHPLTSHRWLNSDAGDMLIGHGDDFGRNHRALVDAMSRSLVDRHLEPARLRFNEWMREREGGDESTVSRAARDHEATDETGKPGDYRAELAHALAHGVLSPPGVDPKSPHAPSSHAVDTAARILGINPVTPPGTFRAGFGGIP